MNTAVIVAAGRGERFGREGGKQLAEIGGRPMLALTISAFEAASAIDAIIVTFDPARLGEVREKLGSWGAHKVRAVVAGGEDRQESVQRGLAAVPLGTDVVAIHDGARPLVLSSDVDACVAALQGVEGAVLGRPAVDTTKLVDAEGIVMETLDRSRLWLAETPQVFKLDTLLEAHRSARDEGIMATDDAALVERRGGRVRMVRASAPNPKVTAASDVRVAEALLAERSHA